VVFSGGTLDGVTYDGDVAMTTNYQSVAVIDGITLKGANGTGNGAIDLTAYDDALYVEDANETLNNATITLSGSYDQITDYVTYASYAANGYAYPTQTLTFGSGLTINQSGSDDYIGNNSGDGYSTIVNDGSINATAGYIYIDPTTFENDGTIALTGSGGVYGSGASFTNKGTITVGSGSDLSLQDTAVDNASGGKITVDGGTLQFGANGASNTATNEGSIIAKNGATISLYGNAGAGSGTLTATGSTLNFYGSVTDAGIEAFDSDSDTISIYGTLNNAGQTLTVGSGAALTQVTLQSGGIITGGTIKDNGSGVVFSSGTLNGVIYDGTLAISANYQSFAVTGGLTLKTLAGTAAGAVDFTGYGDALYVEDSETLDNATITLGGGYSQIENYVTYATYQAAGYTYTTQTLTFGSGLTIDQSGGSDYIGDNKGDGYSTIVNAGTIDASGGSLYIQPTSFDNKGAITISGGDQVSITPGAFTNEGTITVGGSSQLTIGGAAAGDTGAIDIGAGSTAILQNQNLTDAVKFTDTTGKLVLDNSKSFSGKITGLSGTDTLDLADLQWDSGMHATWTSANGGTLTVSDGTNTVKLALLGQYSASTFNTSEDASGGTMVVDPVIGGSPVLPGAGPSRHLHVG
jgi:hypothetical protein